MHWSFTSKHLGRIWFASGWSHTHRHLSTGGRPVSNSPLHLSARLFHTEVSHKETQVNSARGYWGVYLQCTLWHCLVCSSTVGTSNYPSIIDSTHTCTLTHTHALSHRHTVVIPDSVEPQTPVLSEWTSGPFPKQWGPNICLSWRSAPEPVTFVQAITNYCYSV